MLTEATEVSQAKWEIEEKEIIFLRDLMLKPPRAPITAEVITIIGTNRLGDRDDKR
jgi:hypothetical protein